MVHYRWNTVTDNILCEQDDAGQLLATYTQEPGLYGELISQRRDGSTNYYHFDAQQSTRQLTDQNQSVTDEYTYSAFGEIVASSGTTVNPFGYKGALGYYANPESSLTYVRARNYRASMGVWISRDPVGARTRYDYVGSNPLNAMDPSGRIAITVLDQDLLSNDPKDCGKTAFRIFDFILSAPAPCEGYIVQLVNAWCTINDCVDCPKTLPAHATPDLVFLEAWHVGKGGMRHARHNELMFTDAWSVHIIDHTCGISRRSAEIKFYCKDKNDPAANGVGTGDLGEIGKNPLDPNSPWSVQKRYHMGPNCTVTPGFVPSIGHEPGWWYQRPAEGTASHFFQAHWNCCPCQKNFLDVEGTQLPVRLPPP